MECDKPCVCGLWIQQESLRTCKDFILPNRIRDIRWWKSISLSQEGWEQVRHETSIDSCYFRGLYEINSAAGEYSRKEKRTSAVIRAKVFFVVGIIKAFFGSLEEAFALTGFSIALAK